MKKLTTKKSIALYGCAGFGVNLLNTVVGSYLCSALLTGGFREHIDTWTFNERNLVVAGLWSVIILVAKIVDGIIDIPMSSFTDNLKTKWGRRRPAILLGYLPMILAYVLFVTVIPDPNGPTVGNTLWFGAMLCVFYGFYTLTMLTYYATFSEIVDNDRDRVFLSNIKSICDVVYFSMSYALVPVFVNGGINIRTVALCTIPLSFTMIIPFFLIKEDATNEQDGETVAPGEAKGVNLIRALGIAFRNKAFLYWLCVIFVFNIGSTIFLSGINEFFSTTGLSMVAVMASSFAPVPVTILLYNRIVKKHGMRTAFQYVMGVFSLAMILMFIFKPMATRIPCAGTTVRDLKPGSNYAVTVRVDPTEEEKEGGAEAYNLTEIFTADENGVIDLTTVTVRDEHRETEQTYAAYAEDRPITVSEKKALQTPIAICCGIIASFAIGAFFSFSYTIPSELAAVENARTGICASSMYFAVEGLFEGISAGLASGPILVFIKQRDIASYIPLFVTAACMTAFFMAFFLSKTIAGFGKEKKVSEVSAS